MTLRVCMVLALAIAIAIAAPSASLSKAHHHVNSRSRYHLLSSRATALHHPAPQLDLDLEEEDKIKVEYTDQSHLPGLVSLVSWIGVPTKLYDIYAGDFADQSTWKLVEGEIALEIHPTAGAAPAEPAKPKKISKSIARDHSIVSEAGAGGVKHGKHVIVCEAGSKDVCGSAEIVDKFDETVWWTADGKPRATLLPFLRADGTLYTSGKFDATACDKKYRGVFHTTEQASYRPSQTSYYGHTSVPHFTVAAVKEGESVRAVTYQHLPIDVAARSLSAVEQNQRCAIQIAIVSPASQIQSLAKELKDELKQLIAWVSGGRAIPLEAVQFYADSSAVQRMTPEMWTDFSGWCGHQHLPGNNHWDPGMLGTGPQDASPLDWATSSLYTDYGLKITQCNTAGQWAKCNDQPEKAMEEDDE